MITIIPLKVYLEHHELTEGTTLISGCNVGRFREKNGDAYGVELDTLKGYMEVPEEDIVVPIKVQKFYVVDSNDPDITALLT